MRLLIDIGNTRLKYVFEHKSTSEDLQGDLSRVYYLTDKQLNDDYFDQHFSLVTEIIVASVNSADKVMLIEHWANKNQISFLQVHSENKAHGVKSSYQQPSTLGIDRWLTMVGAANLYPLQDILIIDAGTALTIDILTKSGQHGGGWIMPGRQTMFNSLLQATEKVHATPLAITDFRFGENTSECVHYGANAMVVGAIKEAINLASKKANIDHIVMLGGDSEKIIGMLDEKCILICDLIFRGLQCYRAK